MSGAKMLNVKFIDILFLWKFFVILARQWGVPLLLLDQNRF